MAQRVKSVLVPLVAEVWAVLSVEFAGSPAQRGAAFGSTWTRAVVEEVWTSQDVMDSGLSAAIGIHLIASVPCGCVTRTKIIQRGDETNFTNLTMIISYQLSLGQNCPEEPYTLPAHVYLAMWRFPE